MKLRTFTVPAAALALLAAPTAHAVTYTLEPLDYDDIFGSGSFVNLTQEDLGGSLCPCVKILYPADGLNDAQGVAAVAAAPLQAGDNVLGFSLGSVVISAYLNANTPPPGVNFILLGDSSAPDGMFAATGLLPLFGGGIPANTPDPVTVISRQYDGWTDWPTNMSAPGYLLAVVNAMYGGSNLHDDYTEASLLNNPANVTRTQGNVTYELVPTQNLPINDWLRSIGLSSLADELDTMERPLIDAAYTTPQPTAAQLAASTGEQAQPLSAVLSAQTPEPVADPPAPKVAATAPLTVSPPQRPLTLSGISQNVSASQAQSTTAPKIAAAPLAPAVSPATPQRLMLSGVSRTPLRPTPKPARNASHTHK